MMRLRPTDPRAMTLAELAALANARFDSAAGDQQVTGISLSTTRIEPGDLYAALPGTRVHGARYVADAMAAGARAVLTDAEGAQLAAGVAPILEVSSPRDVLGVLAAEIYRRPSEHVRMLGVTGTQGKTTTTRLLEAALSVAGVSAGAIGTVGTRINGVPVDTALTTPEAPDLQGLLAVMREEGVQTCAMEVSSHALVLGRVNGVVFDVAAFTNLGRDHLDFHETAEEYFEAKAQLFTPVHARRALINSDDEHGRILIERGGLPISTFALNDPAATWRAEDIVESAEGSAFRVRGPGIDIATRVNIPGLYNVSNALCAFAMGVEAGFDAEAIATGLAAVSGVPGRLERIGGGPNLPSVYVDYAHKPDAVSAALRALRPLTEGRLIIVIGAGGDRDTGKRALMGAAAAELADRVVITDDNPRSEDPALIREAVAAGARSVTGAHVRLIGDRAEAIREAITGASPGDIVVIAGKGHETGQEIAGIVHPFDDAAVVRHVLGE